MNDLLTLILTLTKTYLMYPPNLENKQLHVWKYRKRRRFPSKRTSWCRRGEGVIRQRPEPAWAGRAEIQRSISADLREPAERIAIFKWLRDIGGRSAARPVWVTVVSTPEVGSDLSITHCRAFCRHYHASYDTISAGGHWRISGHRENRYKFRITDYFTGTVQPIMA